jgi:hypothetical protein
LNKEGEFTEAKMDYKPIYADGRDPKDVTELVVLSVIDPKNPDNFIHIYGYLFDVIKDDENNIYLIMGFDGKDGKRFITAIGVFGSAFDYYHDLESGNEEKDYLGIYFAIERGAHLGDANIPQPTAYGSDQIYDYLKALKNKKDEVDVFAKYLEMDETFTGGVRTLTEVFYESLPSLKSLVNKLATNGLHTESIGLSSYRLQFIYSSDDFDRIDFKNIPKIIGVNYRDKG